MIIGAIIHKINKIYSNRKELLYHELSRRARKDRVPNDWCITFVNCWMYTNVLYQFVKIQL